MVLSFKNPVKTVTLFLCPMKVYLSLIRDKPTIARMFYNVVIENIGSKCETRSVVWANKRRLMDRTKWKQ